MHGTKSTLVDNYDFSRSRCSAHDLPIKALNLDSTSKKILLCEKCLKSRAYPNQMSINDCFSLPKLESMCEEAETLLKVKEYNDHGNTSELHACVDRYFSFIDSQFDSLISKLVSYKMEFKAKIIKTISLASLKVNESEILDIKDKIEDLLGALSTSEELVEDSNIQSYCALLETLNKSSITQGFREHEPLHVEFNSLCRDFSRRTDEFFKRINSLFEHRVNLFILSQQFQLFYLFPKNKGLSVMEQVKSNILVTSNILPDLHNSIICSNQRRLTALS